MYRLCVGVIVLLLSTNAYAYIDPGTASLMLQGILAAVATGLATVGIYFQKIKSFFTRKKVKKDDAGVLVDTVEIDIDSLGVSLGDDVAYLVKHKRIPFISYPYEWSFSALKSAAIFHLDLQIDLLNRGFTLSDATAYNIQFLGTAPIFIDLLSIRPYKNGEYWLAHRQFCEQFIAPLLLQSKCGIAFNDWYRGTVNGIPLIDLAKILPFKSLFSWNVLAHIFFQAKIQQKNINVGVIEDSSTEIKKAVNFQKKPLPKSTQISMLKGIRKWLSRLQPADSKNRTVWQSYSSQNTYNSEAVKIKRDFISRYVQKEMPKFLWDFGCNTGEYSELVIANGVKRVIGLDVDQGALDAAYQRGLDQEIPFQAIYFDASNTSPSQGWRQMERRGLNERANADSIIALAFIHHMVIGKNIPLDQTIDWLLSWANTGIIEFVGKEDSTVKYMLANREDIFADYNQENFESLLCKHANITGKVSVTGTDRTLYSYEKILNSNE
jgi:ribosomal protein L11 methylase PrmA